MNTRKWLIIVATLMLCIGIGLVATDASAATCGTVGQACNDNNTCTTNDVCITTSTCRGTSLAVGTACNDSNACTTNDVCVTGSPVNTCRGTTITCDDSNVCTDDSCVPATGCVFTNNTALCDAGNGDPCTGVCSGGACTTAAKPASYCDDLAFCTTDSCNIADPNADPVTGCVHTVNTSDGVCIITQNNNFTMVDKSGALAPFGGTNDVQFVWDGTLKTSVAVSSQVANASLSSSCPFFGGTWVAHEVAIYGPGTYEVFTGCNPGEPGCGTGTSYVFTVNDGEIGGHMLFDWNGNNNIDVVDVWQPAVVFGPNAQMWTGACLTGDPAQVWDWMSYGWYFAQVTGATFDVNGAPMLDGPFSGSFANFNMMGIPPCFDAATRCDDSDPCTNDSCTPTTGVCTHTPVVCPPGVVCDPVTVCGLCLDKATRCNDNNACTDDNCNDTTGACTHSTTNCNDGNACTTDSCNTATGCLNTPISCDDSNPCTADSCDTASGCVRSSLCPNDGDVVAPHPTVDSADAFSALRIAAGLDTPDTSELLHGDVAPIVNGISAPDGKIDMGDVLLILRKALKLENRF